MDKSLIREIKCIINEIEEHDYISKVKYVIFLICKELYNSKNEYPVKNPSVFTEYSNFDLKVKKAKKRNRTRS